MRQLETVHLGWCTSVTDADVRALARLPSLRKLDLARTLVGLALHTWLLRSPHSMLICSWQPLHRSCCHARKGWLYITPFA